MRQKTQVATDRKLSSLPGSLMGGGTAHQWSPPALDSECSKMDLPGKMWPRCISGLKVVGVGNHFLIRSAACPQEGIQDWYYKPGQKSKAREIRGARAEPITAVSLNGNVLKPCRPVLLLAFAEKRFCSESPCRCTACQRPENKGLLSAQLYLGHLHQLHQPRFKNIRKRGQKECKSQGTGGELRNGVFYLQQGHWTVKLTTVWDLHKVKSKRTVTILAVTRAGLSLGMEEGKEEGEEG